MGIWTIVHKSAMLNAVGWISWHPRWTISKDICFEPETGSWWLWPMTKLTRFNCHDLTLTWWRRDCCALAHTEGHSAYSEAPWFGWGPLNSSAWDSRGRDLGEGACHSHSRTESSPGERHTHCISLIHFNKPVSLLMHTECSPIRGFNGLVYLMWLI